MERKLEVNYITEAKRKPISRRNEEWSSLLDATESPSVNSRVLNPSGGLWKTSRELLLKSNDSRSGLKAEWWKSLERVSIDALSNRLMGKCQRGQALEGSIGWVEGGRDFVFKWKYLNMFKCCQGCRGRG